LEKAEADSLFLGNCETLEPIFLEHEWFKIDSVLVLKTQLPVVIWNSDKYS
jgi:hypothetical protein